MENIMFKRKEKIKEINRILSKKFNIREFYNSEGKLVSVNYECKN